MAKRLHINYLTDRETGAETLTVFYQGQTYHATDDHPAWQAIWEGVIVDDDPKALELFDVAQAVTKRLALSDRISYSPGRPNGKLFFDGDQVISGLADHIVRMVVANEDVAPFVLLMENIMQNPSDNSREQLLNSYLDKHRITITHDGKLVLYKYVYRYDQDGKSYRSGHAGPNVFVNGEPQKSDQIAQSVGDVVSMPRSTVTDDKHNACASGLHCGSWGYVANSGNVRLEIHVHPRDVVSVPLSDPKVRVCRYEIIGERTEEYQVPVLPAPLVKPVVVGDDVQGSAPVERASLTVDEESPEEPAESPVEGSELAAEPLAEKKEENFAGLNGVKHPSPAEFKAVQARSKTRRRPIRSLVEKSKSLNWTLVDPKLDGTHRTHWAVS